MEEFTQRLNGIYGIGFYRIVYFWIQEDSIGAVIRYGNMILIVSSMENDAIKEEYRRQI